MTAKIKWTAEEHNSLINGASNGFTLKEFMQILPARTAFSIQARCSILKISIRREMDYKDLAGKQFGKLTANERLFGSNGVGAYKRLEWLCKCECCDRLLKVTQADLLNGRAVDCKRLTRQQRKDALPRGYERRLLNRAKYRALRRGVPFSITVDDIPLPDICPVLGIPLIKHVGHGASLDNSPSIDRIVPSLGYVPGNVVIISWRANRIKSDASVDELRLIANWLCDEDIRMFSELAAEAEDQILLNANPATKMGQLAFSLL